MPPGRHTAVIVPSSIYLGIRLVALGFSESVARASLCLQVFREGKYDRDLL